MHRWMRMQDKYEHVKEAKVRRLYRKSLWSLITFVIILLYSFIIFFYIEDFFLNMVWVIDFRKTIMKQCISSICGYHLIAIYEFTADLQSAVNLFFPVYLYALSCESCYMWINSKSENIYHWGFFLHSCQVSWSLRLPEHIQFHLVNT